jgi:hypothetical protein
MWTPSLTLFACAVLLPFLTPATPARGAVAVTGLAIESESCGQVALRNNAVDPDEVIELAGMFRNNGPDPVTFGTVAMESNENVIVFQKDQVLGKMAVGQSVTAFSSSWRGAPAASPSPSP